MAATVGSAAVCRWSAAACQCLILGSFIVPALAASPPISSIRLSVTPPTMHQGFTSQLTINCTFDHRLAPQFGTLVTLVVSKEIETSGHFSDLVSFSSFDQHPVDVKNDMGGTVRGAISASGVAFISLEWNHPTADLEGRYRCEALGMDNMGHPSTSSDTAEIEEQMIDLSMAFTKINELKVSLHQCENSLNKTSDVIGNCDQVKVNLTAAATALDNCTQHANVAMVTLTQQNNNLTTLATRCEADRSNLSLTFDSCRHDLTSQTTLVHQLLGNVNETNAKLAGCLAEKNTLTTDSQDCKNKELVLKNDLDQCKNDTHITGILLNTCKQEKQQITTMNNNLIIDSNNCRTDVANLNTQIQTLSGQLKTLEDYKTNASKVIEYYVNEVDMMVAMMRAQYQDVTFEFVSNTYQGKRYYLSRPLPRNVTQAVHTCNTFGGILAEINDVNEYNFVKSFCASSGSHSPRKTILGATDENSDGHWRYLSSGKPVDFLGWYKTEPNGKEYENCMFLWWYIPQTDHDDDDEREVYDSDHDSDHHHHDNDSYAMFDEMCYEYHTPTRFLCEVAV